MISWLEFILTHVSV